MATSNVNVPTNTKIKEKDVNAKLQLYGIYAAFAQGKVPSNKQIDVAMNSALQWNGMSKPNSKLSAEGQHLVADLRDVIEKAKILLLTKNQGNLLQDFIYRTQGMTTEGVSGPNAPVEKETAKQQGREAVEGLRTLGELMITNGQFRKLLNDATVLLRDIAGDAAQKAAGKVNPSDEQLQGIDNAAEDNTWHEKPDYGQMKSNFQNKMPMKKQDVKEAGQDAADKARADANNNATATDGGKQGAKTGAANFQQNLSSRFDEDQKQKMRDYRERTNNYFQTKVPKERRDQTIYRLKKMIVEIQTHQDYNRAIDTLLRLAEEYAGHGKNVAGQGQGTVKGAAGQDSVTLAQADLRELLERFANSTSFDDAIDAVNQIYRDADQDPELKQWFRDLDSYIRRLLKEEGYVLEESSTEEWNRLYEQGRFLLRERYRNHTDRLIDEFKHIGEQFDADPENKAFAASMDKLFKDLGNDQDGQPTFKPHLVKDLTEVLIPAFFENVRYVPIPRIEYSDKMIDAIVENLVIEGDNLAPNIAEFGSDNYFRWGRKGAASRNKNKVMLSVSGIQMDLRDVAYYIKKKEGFPGITDKGVMDIFLGGSGLSFKVAMETADKSDKQHFFKINTVTVDIQNMNIKLKQSNHKLLFNLFKPILFKVMKPVIQKVVEKQVRDSVTQGDAFLYKVKQEADRATEEAKSEAKNRAYNNMNADSETQKAEAQNFYKRYANAFQRELQKSKDKKEAEKSKNTKEPGQTNIAMTQQDSIFKNISLPGGISTKATEYKQLADKGDRWESPVFSIGSAGESTKLPTPSKPSRKPHNATPMELKQKDGSSIPGSTGGATSGLTSGTSGLNSGTSGLTSGNTSGLADTLTTGGGASGLTSGANNTGATGGSGFNTITGPGYAPER